MNRPLAPALVLALLVGCSAGSAGDGTETGQGAAGAPAAAPTTAAPAAPRVLDVRYTGGEVSGVDSRVPVELGEQVVLRVTSDVEDEVHVHGYDLDLALVPGRPAEVTFTADIAGVYEVELHDARRPLFQLRVS